MHSLWFGIAEVVLGALGLVLGVSRRSSRLTTVIAAGLLVMGLAHFLRGKAAVVVSDVGGVVLLIGLVVMALAMRRARKDGGS
ncbi:hypothetical protein [Sulfobacillus harzensis]|uniref:Uncharacterized protein n=1 Tax=Sulfobacillus harzensis TaxID=2729629 RepID=A0A7Y0Q1T4_9FIRM|nr:hypothetical protein [Sulfobacillus harzensis]NMP21767.1 hypothetical protein [Sulfobacillus harzensis]